MNGRNTGTEPVERRVQHPDCPDVRAMFARTLQAWAGDALRLRRTGLDRPSFRRGGPMGAPARLSLISASAGCAGVAGGLLDAA